MSKPKNKPKDIPKDKRIHATMALSCHRTVDIRTMESMLRTLGKTDKIMWTWAYNAEALIERSRNILATLFIKDPGMGDVLIFIDDDIVFAPEHAEAIVQKARDRKGVVGGFYTTRWENDLFITIRFPEPCRINFHPSSEPIEAECVSSGFMAIDRSVLERLKPYTPYFENVSNPNGSFYQFFKTDMVQDKEGKPLYMSEDWYLCYQARKLNIPVYADPATAVGHTGTKVYFVHEFVAAQNAKAGRTLEGDPMNAPPVSQSNDPITPRLVEEVPTNA